MTYRQSSPVGRVFSFLGGAFCAVSAAVCIYLCVMTCYSWLMTEIWDSLAENNFAMLLTPFLLGGGAILLLTFTVLAVSDTKEKAMRVVSVIACGFAVGDHLRALLIWLNATEKTPVGAGTLLRLLFSPASCGYWGIATALALFALSLFWKEKRDHRVARVGGIASAVLFTLAVLLLGYSFAPNLWRNFFSSGGKDAFLLAWNAVWRQMLPYLLLPLAQSSFTVWCHTEDVTVTFVLPSKDEGLPLAEDQNEQE